MKNLAEIPAGGATYPFPFAHYIYFEDSDKVKKTKTGHDVGSANAEGRVVVEMTSPGHKKKVLVLHVQNLLYLDRMLKTISI